MVDDGPLVRRNHVLPAREGGEDVVERGLARRDAEGRELNDRVRADRAEERRGGHSDPGPEPVERTPRFDMAQGPAQVDTSTVLDAPVGRGENPDDLRLQAPLPREFPPPLDEHPRELAPDVPEADEDEPVHPVRSPGPSRAPGGSPPARRGSRPRRPARRPR